MRTIENFSCIFIYCRVPLALHGPFTSFLYVPALPWRPWIRPGSVGSRGLVAFVCDTAALRTERFGTSLAGWPAESEQASHRASGAKERKEALGLAGSFQVAHCYIRCACTDQIDTWLASHVVVS